MKRTVCALLSVVLAIVALSGVVLGEGAARCLYQGRLTDPDGVPVDDGNYLIKFIIYDGQTGQCALEQSIPDYLRWSMEVFSVHLGAPPDAAAAMGSFRDR